MSSLPNLCRKRPGWRLSTLSVWVAEVSSFFCGFLSAMQTPRIQMSEIPCFVSVNCELFIGIGPTVDGWNPARPKMYLKNPFKSWAKKLKTIGEKAGFQQMNQVIQEPFFTKVCPFYMTYTTQIYLNNHCICRPGSLRSLKLIYSSSTCLFARKKIPRESKTSSLTFFVQWLS